MAILVLGGAGYIGSHTVDKLVSQNYDVVVIDNLLTGHRKAVHPDARFYEGDCRDKAFMTNIFKKETIDGVVH
ncbi:MAG: NAD-dependent epimerase/dehydratase family protein, partial [Enterococcus hulanensis]